jgi:hypothetical protein
MHAIRELRADARRRARDNPGRAGAALTRREMLQAWSVRGCRVSPGAGSSSIPRDLFGVNQRVTQSLPHKSPFFRASYAHYRVGQYTRFGGYEGVRQDGVFFCGEHTSQSFQGFMEGARVTQAIKRLIKRDAVIEHRSSIEVA